MTRAAVLVTLSLLVAVAAYLTCGFAVVAPGEVVVVRRLGRVLERPWGPGLHWGLPAPLERRDRVRTEAVRRLEVGLVAEPGPGDDPGAGEFLTGDLNLMLTRAVVQYRVADPVAHVLSVADLGSGSAVDGSGVEPLLRRLAESSLAGALAGRTIDDALRSGRAEVARDARDELARRADRLGLGVAVLGVSLTDARPPVEVAPAFAEAQAARSARDRRLQEAATYQATSVAAARAEAGARLERARAAADRVATLARARAERFEALRAEAARDRRLTVQRLYLDTLRDLLPGVRRTLVLAPEEPLDLSIVDAPRGP